MNRLFRLPLVLSLAILVLHCSAGPAPENEVGAARDPHSFSRPDEAVVRHLMLDLDVDFESRKLTGMATLTIENLTGTDELWLDAWGLDITAADLGNAESATDFRFGEERPYLGRPLIVAIEPRTRTVRLHYSSSPDAAALQCTRGS